MKTEDRVFQFIVEHIDQTGASPSMREILAGCGLASTSVSAYHVRALERDGRIECVSSEYGKRRHILVVGHGSTVTSREGAAIGRLIVRDAQPARGFPGEALVNLALLDVLKRWTERVGA